MRYDDMKLKAAHHAREDKFISYESIFTRDKVGRINFICYYCQTFRFRMPRLHTSVKKIFYARYDTILMSLTL